MAENKYSDVCGYMFLPNEKVLKVNCLDCIYGASIEDFPSCMARTIDKLIREKSTQYIILSQTRDFEYDYNQVKLLSQIADSFLYLVREKKIITPSKVSTSNDAKTISKRIGFLQKLLTVNYRRDPIGAYVLLTREIRHIKALILTDRTLKGREDMKYYIRTLDLIKNEFEKTDLIKLVKGRLVGYEIGNRALYRDLFHPLVRPNFMLTRYMMIPPKNSFQVDQYFCGEDTEVKIYKVEGQTRKYYHILPPEFRLSEDEYMLLDIARQYMSEHKPAQTDFADPEKMREQFYNIGKDMLAEIAQTTNKTLSKEQTHKLAKILTRYTAGYGIMEVILEDQNIQDLFINAPKGNTPIYILHEKYEDCVTNIIPTMDEAESWATRFRIESGRPLDEANPVLDTEIDFPGGRARIGAVTKNLSPSGLAFSIRRHRDKPWTFPLLVHYKSFNCLAAGLLTFIIDGARTMLFAGTRSAGKSSILGASLTALLKRYRVITVEDTLELPVEALKGFGYNIVPLKSRSIITHVESELTTAEAIRTALRLGDSCLIIGEVRSKEALALYESMRIGALANLVAGTIHGDSPYGVYDRVVNDLGVPPTSFKATDIIVVMNRLKSADGLHTYRRMVEITEVLKDWTDDPLREKGFSQLMVYNSTTDQIEPTETLLNGESVVLNEIANRIADFKNNWDLVWNNIKLREKIIQTMVDYAHEINNLDVIEAEFWIDANSRFHVFQEEVKKEVGSLDSEKIFDKWNDWFVEASRKFEDKSKSK
ncbi:MAG: type II/IV secretion system ATPase subunit [Candidatus Aenigmarchaeota archaeon]|nr:type II/IV secretion system ATPase subunit [Candidatus Aenigmarchaeota archaeon]